jgi:hypothetical protein
MSCQSCKSPAFQSYYCAPQPCIPNKAPIQAYGSLYDTSNNYEIVTAATTTITDSQIVTYDVTGPLKNMVIHRNSSGVLDGFVIQISGDYEVYYSISQYFINNSPFAPFA